MDYAAGTGPGVLGHWVAVQGGTNGIAKKHCPQEPLKNPKYPTKQALALKLIVLAPSKKHLNHRTLGRLEPTALLKYRTAA